MESITVFFIVEIIGTVAFACSGAMVAIKKNLDLLGIIVLGVTTAVGGECSVIFLSEFIRRPCLPILFM